MTADPSLTKICLYIGYSKSSIYVFPGYSTQEWWHYTPKLHTSELHKLRSPQKVPVFSDYVFEPLLFKFTIYQTSLEALRRFYSTDLIVEYILLTTPSLVGESSQQF